MGGGGTSAKLAPQRSTKVDLTNQRLSRYQSPSAAKADGGVVSHKLHADSYRAIVDTAVDAIVLSDHTGTIHSFNPAAEKIFGYRAEEVIGLNLRMLMPELYRSQHDGYMRAYSETGERKIIGIGRTVAGQRKDGSVVPLDLSIAEWRDKNGERCFTGIMRDVTERVRLYQEVVSAADQAEEAAKMEHELLRQVSEANRELKRANEGLQKFTSIVAHDLRGPLRRIEAFMDVLREDYGAALDEGGTDILDRISRGAGRMRQMLDSLLQYSRYNSAAIAGKTANLNQVIADALATFDLMALNARVTVTMDGPGHVLGDGVLLSHVMQNLIGNAVKFRRSGPCRINIRATSLADRVTVSVADNGIGIEAKFAEQVFEMFSRLHDEEAYEGTGIGLAVCRKIINDHDGRIWVDQSVKSGTAIVFTLPLADAPPALAEKPRPRTGQGR